MSFRHSILTFTDNYSEQTDRLKREIETADAILIGAGAGMSASAGMSYSGERFMKYFSDFHQKYGIRDMYSGGFYPYRTLEEYWAWWSRHVLINRYDVSVGKPYTDLLELVKEKNYFVLTSNVDNLFQLAVFQKKRLFYTQGDYGPWQCSRPCHDRTYDNEEFIRRYQDLHILFLELGVGANTPGIIKYPFWRMTAQNPKAIYACINYGETYAPKEIAGQSICIDGDIRGVLPAFPPHTAAAWRQAGAKYRPPVRSLLPDRPPAQNRRRLSAPGPLSSQRTGGNSWSAYR